MTAAAPHDLTIRPIAGPGELDLFNRLPHRFNEEFAGDLEDGRRLPGWMWLALDGGRPVARAAWWGRRRGDDPFLLDVLDLDDALDSPARVGIGERLLRTAAAAVLPAGTRPPPYSRLAPPDWRDRPEVRRGVEDRTAAAARTGARMMVERLRLEWRPGTPVPPPTGRLSFRPAAGREELVGLMTRVLEGTLDAYSRDDLARMTPEQAAAGHYDGEFAGFRSPREWWRVAELPGGEPVGFVVAARNAYNPVIAYLGVLPEHRGRGWIDEVLAEGTRVLAAEGVPRIRAATDTTNTPMAAAFRRAGYTVSEHTLEMVWP
ncbi:GNAT family N-acetyltransferase [Streptacidiphilus sp. ASG 303]|uniref:GNAT family N-acetyltransferase n=1 Tax=Streptacidiphilus sp. ASG 303 TaxID=2896847 RepID=UPI001E2E45EF|nr:GNAT family N-acetyltransferase [Streptacidiphilus sp. ASG 303]MCD0484386.1 GNAT family N-acetyltransferase [Streptacidiphilus sp. ASG 303]